MATRDKAAFVSQLNTDIAPNGRKAITATKVRALVEDIADSTPFGTPQAQRVHMGVDRSARLNNYMNTSDGRSLDGAKARMWADFGGKPSRIEIWNDGAGDFTMTAPLDAPDNSQVAGGAFYSDNGDAFCLWSDNRARVKLLTPSAYIVGHPGQSVDFLSNQNVGGTIQGLELIGPGARSGTHGIALANASHWIIRDCKVAGVDALLKLKAGGKGGSQGVKVYNLSTPFVRATTNYDLINDVLPVGVRRGFLFEGPMDTGGRVQDFEAYGCNINAPLVSGIDTKGVGTDLGAVSTITASAGVTTYANPFTGRPASITLNGTPVSFTLAAGIITLGVTPAGGETLVMTSASYGGVVNASFFGCRFVSHVGAKLVETALSAVDSTTVVYIPKDSFLPANAAAGMYVDCTLALDDGGTESTDYAYRFINAFEDAGANWRITVDSPYPFTPTVSQIAFIGYGDAASRARFPSGQHQHVVYYESKNVTAVKIFGHYSEDMFAACVHNNSDRNLNFHGATVNNKRGRQMARINGLPYLPKVGMSHKPIGTGKVKGNIIGDIFVAGDPGESNLGEWCYGFPILNETGGPLEHGMGFALKSSNYMAGAPANYNNVTSGDAPHGVVWSPNETVANGEWFICAAIGRMKLWVKGAVTVGHGLYHQTDGTWVGVANTSITLDDLPNKRATALISNGSGGNKYIMARVGW